MNLKRVSFKVAQAIKEAGYPQGLSHYLYNEDNSLSSRYDFEQWNIDTSNKIDAPYVMELWLWLWKEKGLFIKVYPVVDKFSFSILFIEDDAWENYGNFISEYIDSEEAIANAIEYLVANNLVK